MCARSSHSAARYLARQGVPAAGMRMSRTSTGLPFWASFAASGPPLASLARELRTSALLSATRGAARISRQAVRRMAPPWGWVQKVVRAGTPPSA
jgi:hypothetical protein